MDPLQDTSLSPKQQADINQLARDMATFNSHLSVDEAVRAIVSVIQSEWDIIKKMNDAILEMFADRKWRRYQRYERKSRRHRFMSHGKHGLKRPRGHRNVPKNKE